MNAVTVREDVLELPAYPYGTPDPEPPLLPGHGQGGLPIYPYPTVEWFATQRSTRRLRTIVVEHEFLRLTFTPELNGRLYSLYDKLAQREVLFANPELKPALVSVRGVWHATGIEINFPSSHSVTTTDEVSCEVTQRDDGAVTFVAWDTEAVSGLSWECATTLYPGTAAVRQRTRLANPTELPQRWYFWVNAAFPILPGTRYLFPPSTQRIFLEGGTHPGELGYFDYPVHDGVDLSVFENLRHHAAHFAETPDEGWFGLHHPSVDAGIAHVADPNLVCGRKIWSWGFADSGQTWHRALTDTGGPYCEVQSGPLRSQIEYRSLDPGQELVQHDTWLPLRGLGGLSHASAHAAAAWTAEGDTLAIRILAAEATPGATVRLGEAEQVCDLGPESMAVSLPHSAGATLTVRDAQGRTILRAQPLVTPARRVPPRLRAAEPASPGQRGRLAEWQGQFHHARELYRAGAEHETAAAAALARFALQRADVDASLTWARRAMALDWHGLDALRVSALAARLADDRAQEVWYWEELLGHGATRSAAIVALCDDAVRQGELELVVDRASQLLAAGSDLRVFGRLAHALRRLGDRQTLLSWGESAPFRLDPLLAAERWLADETAPLLGATAQLAAAATLQQLGDAAAAERILAAPSGPAPGTPPALLEYAAAFVRDDAPDDAISWPDGFAAGAFAIQVLRHAVAHNEGDAQAQYHLGCALAFAGDWEEATSHWAVATESPWAAEANRNLAVAAWRIHGDREAAAAFYRQATDWDAAPRTLVEQDLLLAELGRHDERLVALESAAPRCEFDSRIPLRLVHALVDSGEYRNALELLNGGTFQLYEGGFLPQALWTRAHLALAAEAESSGQWATAADHYRQAAAYPSHLGVGAPGENQNCETWFRGGEASRQAGDAAGAAAAFEAGAEPGIRLRPHAIPQSERMPEAGPLGLNRGFVRNLLYQALCAARCGRAEHGAALLAEVGELLAARPDTVVQGWLAAAAHGDAFDLPE